MANKSITFSHFWKNWQTDTPTDPQVSSLSSSSAVKTLTAAVSKCSRTASFLSNYMVLMIMVRVDPRMNPIRRMLAKTA